MIASSERESQELYDVYRRAGLVSTADMATIGSTIANPDFPGALIPISDVAERLYVAAPTHLQWQRLAPLLEARIGYELSDFPKPSQQGTAPEDFTATFGGYSPGRWCCIRLAVSDDRRKAAVVACVRLVKNVVRHAADFLPPARSRSTGELLAGFDNAIAHAAFADAQMLLDELRERALLDGLNLRCLQLRLLDERGPRTGRELVALANELRGLSVPLNVRATLDRLAPEVQLG